MSTKKYVSQIPMNNMFNNNSYSVQSHVWIPIKCNRYPSTITWHQIKRQRQLRNDGKANIVDDEEIIDDGEDEERIASQHFFNYRLSMASSVMFFFEYCLSMDWLSALKSFE